jgi:hypothetical protein
MKLGTVRILDNVGPVFFDGWSVGWKYDSGDAFPAELSGYGSSAEASSDIEAVVVGSCYECDGYLETFMSHTFRQGLEAIFFGWKPEVDELWIVDDKSQWNPLDAFHKNGRTFLTPRSIFVDVGLVVEFHATLVDSKATSGIYKVLTRSDESFTSKI